MDFDEIKEIVEDKLEEKTNNKKGFNISVNKALLVVIIFLLITIIFQSIRSNAKIKQLESRDLTVTEIKPSDDIKITQTDLLRAIVPASELISNSYSYANVGVYEKAKHLGEIKVPFTTDKTVYAYSGTISAGIKKLDSITFDIDEENKKIVVNMPKPEILHNEIIKAESYDIKNSLFSDISLKEYDDFKETLMNNEAELLMKEEKFWKNLENNTEKIIGTLISTTNNISEYTVEFKWQH